MPKIIRIQDIAQHVGEEVTLQGWLYHRTDKGKLQFLRVRDGTGYAQCVVFKKDVSPEVFEAARSLTQESSLIVTGTVRQDARAPGLPGGHELSVTGLQVLQVAQDYPIQPKEHGVEFLMDHRHLWIRSQRQWAVLRVRATVIRAIRDWLDDHGFVNLDTPILTPAACEGTTTLFETDYFGTPAYLAQSGQLYNEANIYAFGRVYCFGPTFRAEKSKTRRHLTEFWMVEPEAAFCDLDQLMEIEEQFVSYIVQTCLRERAGELAREIEGAWVHSQFDNPSNPEAHEKTTAVEIWEDSTGDVDIVVAGVGTGGTITGISRYLKKKKDSVTFIAVEPAGSPVLSGGKAGKHSIQGIGAGFIPTILEKDCIDEVVAVRDRDAFQTSRLLAKKEGIFAGISSGAAAWAAYEIAKRKENEGKLIVVIFPDSAEKYLSTGLLE